MDMLQQLLNQRVEVACTPVLQRNYILRAPDPARDTRLWPNQYEVGRQDRLPVPGLAAPPRMQSIAGYTETYNLVRVNAGTQQATYSSVQLRAPRVNEAWSMYACDAPTDFSEGRR